MLNGGVNDARVIRYPTLTGAIIHFHTGSERNTVFAVTPPVLLFSFGPICYSWGQEVELSVRVCVFEECTLTLAHSGVGIQLC